MAGMSSTFLVSQLVGQAPMLIVYLGGIILCAVLWQRASFAAMLAVIGLALMLFTTLGSAIVTNYIIQNRASSTGASMGTLLSISAFVFSVVRAVGLALVIAGVLVQRRPEDRGFDVATEPFQPGRRNY